jgi:ABC-type multidrug transport system fused ATPase/permease subunit/CRP-like cAMP-binding protein
MAAGKLGFVDFRTTSQGELVSMVTSEAEPMGGLMGDAVAQPVFQAGQMMTIMTFLFMQSVWFGLASIALIPLQAYLIPMLQRQINLLNKDRIKEVRHLSAEIGETAAGIGDLRVNGGVRYRLSQFTERLGRLFEIRFRIYQKKFFMKFLNNFITQLTPFFFYAVGGYLAIRGEITVGALVAALAAYKDIASPWKELLMYYNQVQDMSLRWQVVTERFAPSNMIPEELFEGRPATIPHLRGDIVFEDVKVVDQDGNTILEDFNLTIPAGARAAIRSTNPLERRAVAELLTREVRPVRGRVTVAGHPIESLHQAVIAARIGHAHSRPYFFDGTVGDNLLMPLRTAVKAQRKGDKVLDRARAEAENAGNFADLPDDDWFDPSLADLESSDEVRDWWFELVEAMGLDDIMFRRILRTRFDPQRHPALARDIVGLRDRVAERVADQGLDRFVYRFDPDLFNPTVPLGGNLLFASPARAISQQGLASDKSFMQMLRDNDVADDALTIASGVVRTLQQTFGTDGTDHPLFRDLGMDEDVYLQLVDIMAKYANSGRQSLTDAECALMLTVPFLLTAEQIGPGFPDRYKRKIVALRKARGRDMREKAGDMFLEMHPDRYIPRLTVIENALYGRVSMLAGSAADTIEDIVADACAEAGLKRRLATVMADTPTGLGGANLPSVVQERAAFSRAGIKRPDVLVLDTVLASHDSEARARTRQRLTGLLPQSTMLFLEGQFANPDLYDVFVEIKDGRVDGAKRDGDQETGEDAGSDDFRRKLRIIANTDLFEKLDPRNQRLLAFSAQWYEAKAGEVIFEYGQPADAAYLCLEGQGVLRWPFQTPGDRPISVVEPGRLIGDLSIILGEQRQITFTAETDSKFLRIGAQEFRAVMENDVGVAVQLLETVAGHLTGAISLIRGDGEQPPDGTEAAADTAPEATTAQLARAEQGG